MKERENEGVGEGNPKKYNCKCNKPPSSFQGFTNSDQRPYFGIFKYLSQFSTKFFYHPLNTGIHILKLFYWRRHVISQVTVNGSNNSLNNILCREQSLEKLGGSLYEMTDTSY